MTREEFEGAMREVWVSAYNAAGKSGAGVEAMVQTCVGLAYGEGVLDQPAPKVILPTEGPIADCRADTGHAKVEGTHSCRCGHAYYKYTTKEEGDRAAFKGLVDIGRILATEKGPRP